MLIFCYFNYLGQSVLFGCISNSVVFNFFKKREEIDWILPGYTNAKPNKFRYNEMLTLAPILATNYSPSGSKVISSVLFFRVSLELLHADIEVYVKIRLIRSEKVVPSYFLALLNLGIYSLTLL